MSDKKNTPQVKCTCQCGLGALTCVIASLSLDFIKCVILIRCFNCNREWANQYSFSECLGQQESLLPVTNLYLTEQE